MYLNDLEQEYILKGKSGVNVDTLKLFLLMYADDIVIFAESETGLQNGLKYYIWITVRDGALLLIL